MLATLIQARTCPGFVLRTFPVARTTLRFAFPLLSSGRGAPLPSVKKLETEIRGGFPITMGVPVKADTGMSAHTVGKSEATWRFVALTQAKPFQYCMTGPGNSKRNGTKGLVKQTVAVPSETLLTCTSKKAMELMLRAPVPRGLEPPWKVEEIDIEVPSGADTWPKLRLTPVVALWSTDAVPLTIVDVVMVPIGVEISGKNATP